LIAEQLIKACRKTKEQLNFSIDKDHVVCTGMLYSTSSCSDLEWLILWYLVHQLFSSKVKLKKFIKAMQSI